MYIYQLPDWPSFRWNHARVASILVDVRHRQGRLIGRMEALGFPLRQEAVLQTLAADVLKSSEIEGEKLDYEQVRSSLARRLGIDSQASTCAFPFRVGNGGKGLFEFVANAHVITGRSITL